MDPLVMAAGTALVKAMATDAWQVAKDRLLAFWKRADTDSADQVDAELVDTRNELVAALAEGDHDTEQALIGAWQLRVAQLLRTNAALAADLRSLLDDQLAPLLAADDAAAITRITLRAKASGHGKVYQAGRDQIIHGR